MIFHDRTYAAFLLADALKEYKNTNSLVLAVPRGGVPIGYQLAKLLNIPLDIVLCKKIGHPDNPEYAIGAVNLEDIIIDDKSEGLPTGYIESEASRTQEQMRHQWRNLRPAMPEWKCDRKNVIVTDDGIATGRTLLACIKGIRKKNPLKIIIATPVASKSAVEWLMPAAEEMVCLHTPDHFYSISQFYKHFPQVTDEEVQRLLSKSHQEEVEAGW